MVDIRRGASSDRMLFCTVVFLAQTTHEQTNQWVWVLLREIATGKLIHFSTTHYSNTGNCDAKIPSSQLVVEQTADIRNEVDNVIMTGDWNCGPDQGLV